MSSFNLNILIISESEERQSILSNYISEYLPDAGQVAAYSANDALNVVNKNLPVIVFCDEMVGESGCKDLYYGFKEYQSNSNLYFIVVTETENLKAINEYINSGFDDYLIGDKNKTVIHNRLRIASRNIELQYKLAEDNRKLIELRAQLELKLEGIKRLSIKLIETKIPSCKDMLEKIADIAVWIAQQLKEYNNQELFNIEIAAYFSQVGRLFLPDDMVMLPVMSNGRVLNSEMNYVPVSAREILGSMSLFQDASEISYHIWENFDGTGIPLKKQKWQIPLESRIIRAAIDYEENRYFRDLSPPEAINIIKSRINRLYDPKIINLLEQYKGESKEGELSKELAIRINDLQAGMKLTRDLNTASGIKMLNSGTEFTEKNIKIIKSHSSSDPILGYVYIDKDYLKNQLS